ncbi:MAG: adenylate/guanylate cyclase domain-containing protein [Breznakibacter sp.]
MKQIKDAVPSKHEIPKQVAESHKTYSRKYEQVTVLFADIQGFTKIVEHINPEFLVDQLDKYFFKFDEIVEKYGIEKIKTIGDAYMCAGGIPDHNRTNPIEVILAAVEMQQFMKEENQGNDTTSNVWELRIGIHTGPVVSGLVGRVKISFDIWGDTVNIASRMESSGVAGEINITGVTYQYIRDFFICQYRGKMPIKYKGETDMYFVKGIIPELSRDNLGLEPNEDFMIRLQHMRFGDLEEFVLGRLRTELGESLVYHNLEHTVNVLTRAEVLARGEGVSEGDLLIVKTAALLHDIGFLIAYPNHEANSTALAKEILPKFKYSPHQIDRVIELVMATRTDQIPNNILEEIIKDADLDYLGRSDYVHLSRQLYLEMTANGISIEEGQWIQTQYEFIKNHKYYTSTAKRLRQVNKVRQLEKLKMLLEVA